jgi:D-hydroxyproline dehydrogenase subunit gamma
VTERISIDVDGAPLVVVRGVSVASALLDAGVTAFRVSPNGSARAPLCGMGVCYECRVMIDGVPQQRACMRLVEPGMRVGTGAAE